MTLSEAKSKAINLGKQAFKDGLLLAPCMNKVFMELVLSFTNAPDRFPLYNAYQNAYIVAQLKER